MAVKKLSRQRKYQIKQIADGNCSICGKKRISYRQYCDSCAVKQRAYVRDSVGCKSHKKGGRGRPPIVKEQNDGETMAKVKMIVELEWDTDLGPYWMNTDNLRTLLYSSQNTKEELLRLTVLKYIREQKDGKG